MQIYKTPLREFKFLIEDFLNLKESQTLKKLDLETSDLMLIIEEAAKLCEETLLPLNQSGDSEGCCLLYTSPSPRDATLSRMPSSA